MAIKFTIPNLFQVLQQTYESTKSVVLREGLGRWRILDAKLKLMDEEQEMQISNKYIQYVFDLLIEMNDLIENMEKDNFVKRKERISWEGNLKFDDFSFELVPIKEENQKLKEEVKNYQLEQDKVDFSKKLRSGSLLKMQLDTIQSF
ncbi:unnamed protein product [Paramecium octaurelia]|uniref:Uncharacterized protein n=1 Tax=Paramecium octaurelia TaxID=43137 RepID=A0A8S1VUD0_PAROT|nr:unnamed protein product [Paramecium octaurelia]